MFPCNVIRARGKSSRKPLQAKVGYHVHLDETQNARVWAFHSYLRSQSNASSCDTVHYPDYRALLVPLAMTDDYLHPSFESYDRSNRLHITPADSRLDHLHDGRLKFRVEREVAPGQHPV